MQRCSGKTKAGASCRAPAGPDGLCFFHAHPDLAPTLGQIGGMRNRSPVIESPALEPLSGTSLRNILAEAIREVRSRKMTPRNAAALAQLCNSAVRVLPTADLEGRLARIEQQLVQQECHEFVDLDPSSSPGPCETAEQDASSREEDIAGTQDSSQADNDHALEEEGS
jgi:hypothetical protein